jgi:hypothetical protein
MLHFDVISIVIDSLTRFVGFKVTARLFKNSVNQISIIVE